jgi:hypothetical protein
MRARSAVSSLMPAMTATTPRPSTGSRVHRRPEASRHRAGQARGSSAAPPSSRFRHLKDDHRMGRNHLVHASGEAINAALAAAGYNLGRLIHWLRLLLLRILIALGSPLSSDQSET